MREIVSVHIGQAGIQTSEGFWRRLLAEHHLDYRGVPLKNDVSNKETFFYESSHGFIPRSVLVDTDSASISQIRSGVLSSLFPHSLHMNRGTRNIWPNGYSAMSDHEDAFMDLIRREMDLADSFQGFAISHSAAGGTGSGATSYVTELLRDLFPKKTIQTFTIMSESDVVVNPYNTVLLLSRLIRHSDTSLVLDNTVMAHRLETKPGEKDSPATVNGLLASITAAYTTPVRFQDHSYRSLNDVVRAVTMYPRLHFVLPSYSPRTKAFPLDSPMILAEYRESGRGSTSVSNLLKDMIETNTPPETDAQRRYFNVLTFLAGSVPAKEAEYKIEARLRKITRGGFLAAKILRSGPGHSSGRLRGLMLSNDTSVASKFKRTLYDFRRMAKKKVYLHHYMECRDFSSEEFESSYADVADVIEEYASATN